MKPTAVFRKLDLIPAALSLMLFAWLIVPSSVFLSPISWRIDGYIVRFVRETPFGTVRANWEAEISLISGDGFECHGQGRGLYQEADGDTVTYRIGEWARACIEAGPPFTITQSWQVMLFDFIPLRKTSVTLIIEGVRDGRSATPAIGG